MSGHSDSGNCPVCGGSMNTYSDWKPHDYVSGECLDCGFMFYTQRGRLDLDELNEMRKDGDLEPLTKEEYNAHKKDIEDFL